MICEICKKNEGKIHNLYYGNKHYSKKGEMETYGNSTRGERESVSLCDDCIKHKIAVSFYRRPFIFLGLFVVNVALGRIVELFNQTQFSILGCLSTILIISSMLFLVGLIVTGIQAIIYKTNPEKREKEFNANNANEEIAKSLRINELKKHTSYSMFFTQAEYEKIMRNGREMH